MTGEEESKAGLCLGPPPECRNGFQSWVYRGSELHIEEQSGSFSSFGLKTLFYRHFLFLFPCSILLQLLGVLHIKSAVNFMRKEKRGGIDPSDCAQLFQRNSKRIPAETRPNQWSLCAHLLDFLLPLDTALSVPGNPGPASASSQ